MMCQPDQLMLGLVTLRNIMADPQAGTAGSAVCGHAIFYDVFRAAFKPTPSIAKSQETVTKDGANIDLVIHGRHDPVVVPRAVVVVESMAAALMDWETIDAEQVKALMEGRTPNPPAGWVKKDKVPPKEPPPEQGITIGGPQVTPDGIN